MGSYQSHYESYYKNFIKQRKKTLNLKNVRTASKNKGVNRFVKVFLYQSLVVLTITALLLGCKSINSHLSNKIYNFTYELLEHEYDLKKVKTVLKDGGYYELQEGILSYIDKVKVKLMGGKTMNDRIREEFKLPSISTIDNIEVKRSFLGKKEKVMMEVKQKQDSHIKSVANGRVINCGVDKNQEKYIILDHGSGLQSKYYGFENFLVKEGEVVFENNSIALNSGESSNIENKYKFELLYMGDALDITKYITE